MNTNNFASFENFNNAPKNKKTIYDFTPNDIQKTPFLFFQDHKNNYNNMAPTILKGQQTENELSKIFFSQRNIRRIQEQIKQEVLIKTKGKYKLDHDQEETDLLICMRGVYFEHAKFLPDRIVHQVKKLNTQTVNYVVPDMITAIKQYYSYIKEINEPLKPMIRPLNVNNGGRRTLPSVTSLWN